MLPYRRIDQSAVLLSTLAVGCPVVCTDVGGLREVVEESGAGLVVPPGDAPALADAIARILGDPALQQRLASAALDAVERIYSWDVAAERHEAVYRQAAAEHAGGDTRRERRNERNARAFHHVITHTEHGAQVLAQRFGVPDDRIARIPMGAFTEYRDVEPVAPPATLGSESCAVNTTGTPSSRDAARQNVRSTACIGSHWTWITSGRARRSAGSSAARSSGCSTPRA